MPSHAFNTDFTVEEEPVAGVAAAPSAATDDEVELIAHPVEDPWSDKEAFAAAAAAVAAGAEEGAARKTSRSASRSKAKADTKAREKAKAKTKSGAKSRAEKRPAHAAEEARVVSAAAVEAAAEGRHAAHAEEGAASYEEPEAAPQAETTLKTTRTGGRHGTAAAPTAADSRTALATSEAPAPALKVRAATKTRRRRVRIAALSSVAAVLLALAGVYAYGVYHFTDHLLPNTTVAGTDISGMEVSEAKAALDKQVESYKCSISGSDYYLMVRGNDIDFTADTQGLVDRIMGDSDRFRWPLLMTSERTYDLEGLCSWNDEKLQAILTDYTVPHNEGVTHSADAYVAYSPEEKQYIVVPEVSGNEYVLDDIIVKARESLVHLTFHVDLDDESLILPTIYRDNEKLAADAELCNGYLGADFDLVVNISDRWSSPGRIVDHIDGSMLSQWIRMEDGEVFFDEEAMDAWCMDYAKKHCTYGTERTYTRPDGKTFTQGGGTYGWKYDVNAFYKLLKESILAGKTGQVVVPVTQTAAVWVTDDDPEGTTDIGNTYIEIDIETQILRYIVDGVIVLTADTVSGDFRTGMITPYGIYYIVYKLRNTHLRGMNLDGSSYDVPVDYWMSFIGNDYGIHDNPDRWYFGYPAAFRGYGSHGCVNVPYGKARSLYASTVVGCPVVIHW